MTSAQPGPKGPGIPEDSDELRDGQTADDRPIGWGDDLREATERDTDEWYLSERPPHHGT